MTEYTLPFTCKQRDQFFIGLKWAGLIIFPTILMYSILTHQTWTSDKEDLWVHPFFSWGIIGTAVGWITQSIFWIVILGSQDRLPSFRCKCEDEQPINRDVTQ